MQKARALEFDNEDCVESIPLISLHAISGGETSETMKIAGNMGKWGIYILIDTGSTHDFLDLKLARRLGWQE